MTDMTTIEFLWALAHTPLAGFVIAPFVGLAMLAVVESIRSIKGK